MKKDHHHRAAGRAHGNRPRCAAAEALGAQERPPLHAHVIADLQSELADTSRPAERRRIRQTIKAIRRNPDKAVPWVESAFTGGSTQP